MRLNHSEYRPVVDLNRFPEVMDRAARLKGSLEGLIGGQPFRQRISFGCDGRPYLPSAEFSQVEGQFDALIGAIRRRVALPSLDGYVMEKADSGPLVEAHFDRGHYPLYAVQFGDVAPLVVYDGKVLEDDNGDVACIDAVPIEALSGEIVKITRSDYHFRGPTVPTKEEEVRQLLVFNACSRGDWIRRFLNRTI